MEPTLEKKFKAFLESGEPVDYALLADLFDNLESINLEFMLGRWKGGVFSNGHPIEKLLVDIHWFGKTYHSINDVDPLICVSGDGSFYSNNLFGPASLRMVEYKGHLTATMVYDNQPIFDHFKRVNDDIVMGVMDKKNDDLLYFYLMRQ